MTDCATVQFLVNFVNRITMSMKDYKKNHNTCCVHGCHSTKQTNHDLSFHTFPKDNSWSVNIQNGIGSNETVKLRKAWEMKLLIKPTSEFLRVCSLHFSPDDYYLSAHPTLRRRLKRNAIPSQNLPTKSINSKACSKSIKERSTQACRNNKKKLKAKIISFKENTAYDYIAALPAEHSKESKMQYSEEINETNWKNDKLSYCTDDEMCDIKIERSEEFKKEYSEETNGIIRKNDKLNHSTDDGLSNIKIECSEESEQPFSLETNEIKGKHKTSNTSDCTDDELAEIKIELCEEEVKIEYDEDQPHEESFVKQPEFYQEKTTTKSRKRENTATYAKYGYSDDKEERPYPCDLCAIRFKFRDTLVEHKRRCHGVEPPKQERCNTGLNNSKNVGLSLSYDKAQLECREEEIKIQTGQKSEGSENRNHLTDGGLCETEACVEEIEIHELHKENIVEDPGSSISIRDFNAELPAEDSQASTKPETKNAKDISDQRINLDDNENQAFPCDLCDLQFKFQFSLIAHRITIHGVKCTNTKDDIQNNVRLQAQCKKPTQHLRKHTWPDRYECETCGASCLTERGLGLHNKREHGKGKPYKCDICHNYFILERCLVAHKKLHTEPMKPFVCKICNKVYKSYQGLYTHMRTHADNAPYICEICGKTFYFKTILKNHMATHSDERPHLCEFCGKGFKTKHQLRFHKTIHSGLKPFKCDICSKKFRLGSYLMQHKKGHTDEKPFECIVCGRKFKLLLNMKLHRKIHLNADKCTTPKLKVKNQ